MGISYLSAENRVRTLKGILFVSVFAVAAIFLAELPIVKETGFSPLIIGIIISMTFGNVFRNSIPKDWAIGIIFCSKFILRTAIILYGFRITFQNIASIGLPGLLVSIIMVASTFLIGSFVGIKFLKMDADLAMLTASGSAICGAAAVLATESTLKSEPYKSAIALATVVLFGTISMFVYPALYHSGILNMTEGHFGIYIGGAIHEVAQVVAAGNAVGDAAANSGIIVKMTRVMLLAPLLLTLGPFLSRKKSGSDKTDSGKMMTPYFVFGFILVAGFNSFNLLPKGTVENINFIDTFLLTLAMCALGLETDFQKFKKVGAKPIYLATLLFVWLLLGGYGVTKLITSLFS